MTHSSSLITRSCFIKLRARKYVERYEFLQSGRNLSDNIKNNYGIQD